MASEPHEMDNPQKVKVDRVACAADSAFHRSRGGVLFVEETELLVSHQRTRQPQALIPAFIPISWLIPNHEDFQSRLPS
jgi:hypothetical protein